ncbi:MFS general substrate transporter [Glarea lozoyensis ATCC 20868]|uniref:MFS general substrate transporter n=1 Tax=Glarea lozoyensis (strain ATCC 20868 / MF5171) TaxID=1116229 RepID=S3CHL1_GLAL2|nr:MFS general substrate transporter [Glarea lozoyensis ATCC 20868]EPE25325.1 MFS general substrate transporter [Glarea lozoyensis ATCC 20868]
MGIFSRFRSDDAGSSPDHEIARKNNIHGDPEKATDNSLETRLEDSTTNQLPPHEFAAIEKRVLKKLDRRLVSLVFVLYLLAYLDRSNIGNARIAGMEEDLSLSSPDYQWLLTIFYISYIIFEWFALMWKLVPPHIWAAFCVMGWGLTATLQSATFSFSGMMAARFFLGLFEAGFGPGIPFLFSFFYLRHEIGFRCGIFLSAAPLATCFAGALAYGITSDDSPPIANWRLLFLVEGLPCLVAAVATFFLLPDSPEKASFLTPEEKSVARSRARLQTGKADREIGRLNFRDLGAALLDPKNYITALMYFSCNVSFSSLPVFLPTILSEMGFTRLTAQALTAPPYFLAFLLVILTTYIADRTQQRGLTILILSLVATVGYILLATTSSTAPRYVGVFLAAAGVFPAIGNILPWVLNNQGSDTRRGMGIAMLNLIGQCGPLLGTRVYPSNEGPYYRKGMWVCAGFMAFNALLALGLRALLAWENGRLDAKYGRGGEGMEGEEGVGVEDGGRGFSIRVFRRG